MPRFPRLTLLAGGALAAGLVASLLVPHPVVAQTDSLTLVRALRLARARSPVIAEAAAGVREAEAGMAVAKAQGGLRLGANGAYVRFQDPPSVGLGPLGSWTPLAANGFLVHVGARQPLYTGGRTVLGVRAGEAMVVAAAAARNAADVELSATVARAFDDALLARSLRRVAENAVAALRYALRVAREHRDAGTVTALDVLRAESKLATAEVALREAQEAEITARERLAAAVGLAPDAPPEPAGDLDAETGTAASIDPSRLTLRDPGPPDVAALIAEATALEARAKATRASLRPGVGVWASAFVTRPEIVTGNQRWNSELLGGLYLSWPFFDSGNARGQASALEASAARSRARAEQLLDRAAVESRAAYRDLARSIEDARAGRENIDRAERIAGIARDRYADGLGLQLDVLQAEADLTAARGWYLRVLHRVRSAMIELRRSNGLPADASLDEWLRGSR